VRLKDCFVEKKQKRFGVPDLFGISQVIVIKTRCFPFIFWLRA